MDKQFGEFSRWVRAMAMLFFLLSAGVLGFLGWVITKLLQYWGVI